MEDTIEEPVEPTKYTLVRRTVIKSDGTTETVEEPQYEMPVESEPAIVEEEKNRRGQVTRRVVRRPVPVVTRRRVYRKIILAPDGSEKGVEEKVEEPAQPAMPSHEEPIAAPMIVGEQESVPDLFHSDNDNVEADETKIIRKTITIRKGITRKIIVLPGRSRNGVEEEVPEEELVTEKEVTRRQVHRVHQPDSNREEKKKPKPVERVYVTRVIRKPDGIEHLIDESETVYPLEVTPEEQAPETVEEEEKDTRGVVIRRVVRRPVMVTTKRTVIRRSEVLPDGNEKEIEKSVEEAPKQEEEPQKTRRVVRKVTKEPSGQEKVVEEPAFVSPLESSTTEESEPEVEEKRVKGQVIRTVRRRSVKTSQRRVVRRVVEEKDGRLSDKPVEDTIEEPVEPTKYTLVRRTVIKSDGTTETVEEPQYEMPVESEPAIVEEEKNRRGQVTRRVVRRPVPVVTRRRVYRKIILAPDGSEKGVEEKVEEPAQPAMPSDEEPIAAPMVVDEQESVPDMFGDEPGEDGIVRRTVTVRKRIVRKIIVLPDGSRKEVEEEVPEEEPVTEKEVTRRQVHRVYQPDPNREEKKKPKPVERVYVTRVIRKPDGIEHLIDESETVYPLEVTPEEQAPETVEEEEKDTRGVVIRRVVRRPVMVTTKRTVIRRSEVLPDGNEKEIEKSVEEAPKQEEEPQKTRRVVRKVTKEPSGQEKVVEEPAFVSPLESSTTEESEPEVEEKRVKGQVIRTVRRRSVKTSQRRVVRRVVEEKDGRLSDKPVEDTIEEPVEPTKYTLVRRTVIKSDGTTETVEEPQYEMPVESEPAIVEEEKNRRGQVTRRVVRRPVPVVTRRRVYRKIILAPDGSEKGVEEKVEEPAQPAMPSHEEPIAAPMIVGEQESVPDLFHSDNDNVEADETKIIRKTITIRKGITRKIIVLPGRSRNGVEEEVPEEELVTEKEVTRRQVHRVHQPDSNREEKKKPKPVERVYVTRVIRKPDGIEHLIDESETVYPLEVTPEEQAPETVEEEEKDTRGVVIRRVVRRPVMVTTKRTVIRRSEVLPDGNEKEIEKSVEEAPKQEEEPQKTRRVVRKVTKEPSGQEKVVEEPAFVSPLESSTTEESEPEVEEKRVKGQVIRTVRRRSVKTSQRRVVRRVVEEKDGRLSDKPVEDTIEEPVEPTKYTLVRRTVIKSDGTTETVEEPQYEMPVESEPAIVEEEKNRRGQVTRRVVRRPVPVVTRRRVYRKIILAPDGSEKGVEEKVEEPAQPAMPSDEEPIAAPMVVDEQESVPDMFGDEPGEDGIVRRTVTVRKRIVRKIIVLPDGSRKEVEEEVPEEEPVTEKEVTRRQVHRVYQPDPNREEKKKPKPVERVYVTRVIRKPDGIEHLIDESETVYPLEVTPEEQAPETVEEEEKDTRGVVIRRVVRRPVMVTTKRTVIRRSEVLPDGNEKEIEKSVEEAPKQEEEPQKTRRVVRKVTKEPSGQEKVVEEPAFVSPLESSTTEESEPEVEEKRVKGQVIRTVRRRSVKTSQRRVVRRVVEEKDGRLSDKPVEDTIEEPVEPTKYTLVRRTVIKSDGTTETVEEPQYEMPVESEPAIVEEEKNRRGQVTRRVVRRPVPVVTRRRVYRKIILAPDGSEKGVEEKVEEPAQPAMPSDEEPIAAPMVVDEQESVPDMFGDEPGEDGIVRRTVTVRKRIVRKIIVLPDGSRKEVEEEVPEEEPVTEKEVTRRQVHRVYQPDPNREEKKKPKPVERVYVTRVIRKPDGIEHLIDESETVYPLEVTPEEQAPETVEEEEKDTRGVVIPEW